MPSFSGRVARGVSGKIAKLIDDQIVERFYDDDEVERVTFDRNSTVNPIRVYFGLLAIKATGGPSFIVQRDAAGGSGQVLGSYSFAGQDTSGNVQAAGAEIQGVNHPTSTDIGADIVFRTRSAGGSLTRRAAILKDGAIEIGLSGGPQILRGSGSPEGVVSAPLGSEYRNELGGTGQTLWIKETAPTANTGWVAK